MFVVHPVSKSRFALWSVKRWQSNVVIIQNLKNGSYSEPPQIRLMSVACIVQVFTEYFKELEEESIQDNFVVVYELLDELMDFGFPQTTDSKILQE